MHGSTLPARPEASTTARRSEVLAGFEHGNGHIRCGTNGAGAVGLEPLFLDGPGDHAPGRVGDDVTHASVEGRGQPAADVRRDQDGALPDASCPSVCVETRSGRSTACRGEFRAATSRSSGVTGPAAALGIRNSPAAADVEARDIDADRDGVRLAVAVSFGRLDAQQIRRGRLLEDPLEREVRVGDRR